MSHIDEVKKIIRDSVKIYKKPSEYKGGQQCGIERKPIILECEELDLKIELGYHRSDMMNKELALVLFDLVLEEVIK
jgi:hypothetical protein